MIDLESLAAKKATALNEEVGLWRERLRAVSDGLLSRLTDAEIQRVVQALTSVAQLERLEASLGQDTAVMDGLLNAADASPYALSDWLESYDYFLQWLSSQKSSATPAVMLGYLSCCVEFAKGKPQLETLKSLLDEMLSEHGFDGKVPLRLA